MNALKAWIDHRLPIFSFIEKELGTYPTPRNLNYWWNTGSLAGIFLMLMIVTGVFLAMHYDSNAAFAFESVEGGIMRDVNYGWLIRYIHMNGASFFFAVVYIHMFRGLYYGSYKSPRELLWMMGIVILLLMMATAFMGYVLPWGQMSYWGATVITNLFSAFPGVGESIVQWLWGGYSVGAPTLARFFPLHFLFPFLIVGVVMLHLVALHQHGSNNPLGIDVQGPQDTIPFHPYYTIKDLFGLSVLGLVFAAFVFFAPNFFGEPDNYIPANPLLTPPHIVPEWYFLPFYAILRSVPDKLAGVLLMFGSVMILFILPWLDRSPIRSGTFRPFFKWFFWCLVLDLFCLGWIGAQPPEGAYLWIGRAATAYYFIHFLVILPILGKFEKPRPLPISIAHPVLIAVVSMVLLSAPAWADDAAPRTPPRESWRFDGPLGTFDKAQLQRGFQVFKEVCNTCHAVSLVRYRDLAALGFSPEEVKAIAAGYQVPGGVNAQGEAFDRPALPEDVFFKPYPTEESARAANNGAYPVDLSLITKARAGGANYVYALLTGYETPPTGIEATDGRSYNPYFPGHQISMPPPLTDGQVVFSDGTPATVEQMARDVTAFLAWASEPELEVRHRMGVQVMIFLSVLTALLYALYRRIWGRLR